MSYVQEYCQPRINSFENNGIQQIFDLSKVQWDLLPKFRRDDPLSVYANYYSLNRPYRETLPSMPPQVRDIGPRFMEYTRELKPIISEQQDKINFYGLQTIDQLGPMRLQNPCVAASAAEGPA